MTFSLCNYNLNFGDRHLTSKQLRYLFGVVFPQEEGKTEMDEEKLKKISWGQEPGGVKRKGKRLTSEIAKREPWQMTQEEFDASASKGRIVETTRKYNKTEREYYAKKGKDITPLGAGEAAGYAPEDINYFYLNWQMRMGQPHEVASKIARKWLIQDAIKEGLPVPPEVLKDYPELLTPSLLKRVLIDERGEIGEKPQPKQIQLPGLGTEDAGGRMAVIAESTKRPGKIQGSYFQRKTPNADWEAVGSIQFDNWEIANKWLDVVQNMKPEDVVPMPSGKPEEQQLFERLFPQAKRPAPPTQEMGKLVPIKKKGEFRGSSIVPKERFTGTYITEEPRTFYRSSSSQIGSFEIGADVLSFDHPIFEGHTYKFTVPKGVKVETYLGAGDNIIHKFQISKDMQVRYIGNLTKDAIASLLEESQGFSSQKKEMSDDDPKKK